MTLFDTKNAEPGFTPEAAAATQAVIGVVRGFSIRMTMSILMNATAIILCSLSKTEAEAHDRARAFRKEVDRCIDTNWKTFEEEREARADDDK